LKVAFVWLNGQDLQICKMGQWCNIFRFKETWFKQFFGGFG